MFQRDWKLLLLRMRRRRRKVGWVVEWVVDNGRGLALFAKCKILIVW